MADNKYQDSLALDPETTSLMLSGGVHLGGKNVDQSMQDYVFKRRSDGEYQS
jgi:ribosomal protein S2